MEDLDRKKYVNIHKLSLSAV